MERKTLDETDKKILRLVYKSDSLSGNKISELIGLSPSSVFLRLERMEKEGIVKKAKHGKDRIFIRKTGRKSQKVVSPKAIYWEINLK